jgi:hypothetical protein
MDMGLDLDSRGGIASLEEEGRHVREPKASLSAVTHRRQGARCNDRGVTTRRGVTMRWRGGRAGFSLSTWGDKAADTWAKRWAGSLLGRHGRDYDGGGVGWNGGLVETGASTIA